jgi:hypothetical protein
MSHLHRPVHVHRPHQPHGVHTPAAVHRSHSSHHLSSAHRPHRAHQPSTPSYGWGTQGWGLYQNGAPIGGFSPRSSSLHRSRAHTGTGAAHSSDGGLRSLAMVGLVLWGVYQLVHGAHLHQEIVVEYFSQLIHRVLEQDLNN